MEIFKDILGYEGLYQVSNFGNVKSLERPHHFENIKIKKERILKPSFDSSGYFMVRLFNNGKGICYKVHRLVGQAFIENIESKPEINHKNAIKYDNRLENLEWVTSKENSEHAFALKLRKEKYGENHPNCKLTNMEVKGIKILLAAQWKQAEIARLYSVTPAYVSAIKYNKLRKEAL